MLKRQLQRFWLHQNDGAFEGRSGDGNGPPVLERGDEGFLLVGAIVLVFLVLLALTVAAPRIARQMQREKEIESQHRANQYVRAIRMYYKKFNHYPSSVEQLENTNRQRFLREKYIDPLTGKDDWRLIHVGENKTKVKGFFGQDLPGLQAGLGSAASLVSTTGGGTTSTTGGASTSGFGGTSLGTGSSSAFGSSGAASSTGTFGASSSTGTTTAASSTGSTGLAGATTGSGTTGTGTGGSGVSSQNATSATGSGGAIMGVGSSRSGEAMLVINDQTTYQTWEFLYDPRIEQLYAKANLLGGGVSSGSASSLGSASGLASPGQGTTPPAGAAPGAMPSTTSPPTSPSTTATPP